MVMHFTELKLFLVVMLIQTPYLSCSYFYLSRPLIAGVPRIFTGSDQAEISALVPQLSAEDDSFILNYIQNSRININIRQVY
jgi:hypothetical protein